MCHTGRPLRSACVRSNHVGVSIIIYFYVFNLIACGLKTVYGHDHEADHASVYRPLERKT